LIVALTAILSATLTSARVRRTMPSWNDVQNALLETWLEDDEPVVEHKKI